MENQFSPMAKLALEAQKFFEKEDFVSCEKALEELRVILSEDEKV
jgi:hypothetical protein